MVLNKLLLTIYFVCLILLAFLRSICLTINFEVYDARKNVRIYCILIDIPLLKAFAIYSNIPT